MEYKYNSEDVLWAKKIADRLNEKEKIVAERNEKKIPYLTKNGIFDDWSDKEHVCWWTNGFYGGMLWQLYHGYKEDIYKKNAKWIEEKLDENLVNYMGMDHDSGFKWLLTSVASYKISGDKESKNRSMLAAGNLAGRINKEAGLIRAWNDEDTGDTAGWAIIDCMMNLPLLYWASETTKDPRFCHIAKCHADHAIKAFVREDGSVNHIVCFDPQTGKIIKSLGGQGMKEGSSWTRGQSWALYGFTLSYIHTGDGKYLETAKKVAEYVISQIPEDGIVPVDFCQEKECDWEDDTASAIFACGLLELEKHVSQDEKEKYHKVAMLLLKTLTEKRCNWNEDTDYLLEKCSAAYNDENHNFTIIYGDYYYIEAIFKLAGKELFLW